MNRYLKLVNFEVNRLVKLYIGLLIIVAISQFASLFAVKSAYMEQANEANYASSVKATQEFIASSGLLNFNHVVNHPLFIGPILICIALMMFYVFIIWYRDYFGKNTFIYRLFMLPTSRMTIYFAKATTILLMVLSLLAFQLILIPIEIKVFQSIVPTELLGKMSTVDLFMSPNIFVMVLPNNLVDFIFRYLVGMGLVFTLFTFILLERSYRWKGILFGILYAMGIAVLLFSPAIIQNYIIGNDFSFYPSEVIYMELGLFAIIITISILFSKYLLKNKVSV
ncbi:MULTISPECIES: hypothetical protein [unclassified Bacillus (in: firmicutes)]|uniref:hypothetical protein n=1 Tax=unclassified Bacillus (in: firmicutes) TaxID=185979 RepID=UPI000BF09B88|nr:MULTISPECIES: hypothetical protein [unclassified Bacillus (in: firmicutes)]PEJ58311.1 hypothetical protein CN692_08525 [Bacillus sp. AFS002410]PEL08175.1 hypothetical protein CN601_18095 [Bacillus sp. AFS017336]